MAFAGLRRHRAFDGRRRCRAQERGRDRRRGEDRPQEGRPLSDRCARLAVDRRRSLSQDPSRPAESRAAAAAGGALTMDFAGEFKVPGTPEEVIRAFADVERMAKLMPGASLEGRDEEGNYLGVMTVAF